ncbi:Membrane protease subunit, stomatin/prohibitin family, contains C-terminal Zn-ribbon domain [Sphingobacterium nematocida]|uniref:Membrane protease subunit, stomatin/prohibitin family, contains C-terminal Zn-ribbon domain n=1 Tax=Sphingobacterium nematocida TaxID=1513896 RepID=A0A1T5CYA3_9SPHI|nr:SPFH domain-containing protein [Sphingobacterium nematocida]SKB64341.1 Membrane protease subunit, stomatin/prohibitin family, contains C-terminal Zn-ribbon domain [Sphingobacterium nematocida]
MGLFNFFKKQIATVIEWQPQDPKLLVWKYPAATDEIKNASKLIISPGQGCVLVYEGKITDVIDQEGVYNIRTDNHPFITSLLKVAQLFESEHKMGLYYYRKAEVLNQGWGTASAIKYFDTYYKIPIQLSAYGNFSYRLSDAAKFFSDYVGTQHTYSVESFREAVQSRILQVLTSCFAEEKLPYTQIDSEINRLSGVMRDRLMADFDIFGVALSDFRIEGNSFDEDTQNRIGKIADITADSHAASEGGLTYVELEKLRALRDAAKNEGGLAGAGVGLGAGMSLGKVFSNSIDEVTQPTTGVDPMEQLRKLKLLLDENIITQEEFEQKKKEYLNRL